jgi:hypothetical protein
MRHAVVSVTKPEGAFAGTFLCATAAARLEKDCGAKYAAGNPHCGAIRKKSDTVKFFVSTLIYPPESSPA